MTSQKDLKRLVRSRMQKTGESYTSARLQLLKTGKALTVDGALSTEQTPAATVESSVHRTPSTVHAYAQIAGLSDAKVKEATGCAWDRWVWHLDKVEAYNWPHSEIVEYIHTKYKVKSWWTQMVTVGYERIKGLRDKGQRRGGAYEAGKSKTIAVAASRAFRAWNDKRTRARWLPETFVVKTAQKNRSMRITWADGTAVDVGFWPKGKGKTIVAVTHRKLSGKTDAAERKAFWAIRLDALAKVLTAARRKSAA